jgi:hypothetical protein
VPLYRWSDRLTKKLSRFDSMALPADNEIDLATAASRAMEPPRPHTGASAPLPRDLGRYVRLGRWPQLFATRLSAVTLAASAWSSVIGLALGALAPHNSAMPPDLTEDDKAVLVELLRETIERDRFALLPPIERLPAARRKSRRAKIR